MRTKCSTHTQHMQTCGHTRTDRHILPEPGQQDIAVNEPQMFSSSLY